MALVFLDSFDHYLTADLTEKYLAVAGSTAIQAGTGRRSTASLLVQSTFAVVTTRTFSPTDPTTIVVGFALKTADVNTGNVLVIRLGTTVQVVVGFNSSGFAYVNRGVGTNLGVATTGAITAGVYYFVEAKVVIHASAGSVVVRVNELPVLTLPGVNTSASGTAVWNNIQLQSPNAVVQNIDDLYVLDGSGASPLNDLLGDCRVDARHPTAEGATALWTPLSGTDNALMVDDPTPDDDTTYTSTQSIGATDTFVVEDAPVATAQLYAAQLVLSQKKTDAGTCAVAPVVRCADGASVVADRVGTAVNPTTGYAFAVTPYGLNPGTGLAWTEAAFNAAEFGYKRTA